MLCRHHHRALHKGEFQINTVNQEIVFTSTNGEVLQPSPNLVVTAGDDRLKNWPNITKDTSVPFWQGEKIDYAMAVDGLM